MIIVNGVVHDAVNREPYKAAIRIENGKISAVGALTPALGEEIVDAGGMNIFPGLVEAHSHIGLSAYAERGPVSTDVNEGNDCITPELDVIDAINPLDREFEKAVASGVTCVCTGPGSANVLGGTFAAVKTSGRRVDDMIVKRKVAMKCAFGENPKSCYGSKGIATRMTTAAKLRDMLSRTREYIEKKEKAAADPKAKAPDYNSRFEAMIPVLKREIPLKAHAHQTNDVFTAIRIAREFDVKLTIEHCTEGHLIADILAEEGIPLAIGPSFGFPKKAELRHKSFVTPGVLANAGCHVAIITDCGVIPQEYLGLMAGLAVKEGMDPFDAFKAITINAAEHIGIADRVGSIEVGKDADIIICDGSILSADARVMKVFIEGKMVYQA